MRGKSATEPQYDPRRFPGRFRAERVASRESDSHAKYPTRPGSIPGFFVEIQPRNPSLVRPFRLWTVTFPRLDRCISGFELLFPGVNCRFTGCGISSVSGSGVCA